MYSTSLYKLKVKYKYKTTTFYLKPTHSRPLQKTSMTIFQSKQYDNHDTIIFVRDKNHIHSKSPLDLTATVLSVKLIVHYFELMVFSPSRSRCDYVIIVCQEFISVEIHYMPNLRGAPLPHWPLTKEKF